MDEIDRYAKVIWDYMLMHQPLKKADAIFVLGSYDTRVAEYAADLFLQGYAPLLVFSGGLGVVTKNMFAKPEAELFADIAVKKGVPKDRILIENASTNTGENVRFTKRILEERGITVHSLLAVQKPYMERRVFATCMKEWPEVAYVIASPPLSYEEYPTPEIPKEAFINYLVGDLERIQEYPKKGFQIEQEIPEDVWTAFEKLVALGFDKHLIRA